MFPCFNCPFLHHYWNWAFFFSSMNCQFISFFCYSVGLFVFFLLICRNSSYSFFFFFKSDYSSKATCDFHFVKSNGHFSVLILLDSSGAFSRVDHFPPCWNPSSLGLQNSKPFCFLLNSLAISLIFFFTDLSVFLWLFLVEVPRALVEVFLDLFSTYAYSHPVLYL